MIQNSSYKNLMEGTDAFLRLRISTVEPIELHAFVGLFTSLAEEYSRSVHQNNPEIEGQSKIFVKEIKQGSIIAELFPIFTTIQPIAIQVDQVASVIEFVEKWKERITALVNGKIEASEAELNSYFRFMEAIARDPQATLNLQAATFEDGKRQIRAEFTFDTSQAQKVERNIEQIRLIQNEGKEPKYADHIRVLMRFTRSDISRTTIGKKSGERVLIDDIHPKSLAIMYASPLAEQHIKHEIRESEENVFKKAFVVDVNVKIINERPSVYSITHLHEIIDLPDDDD